jgi:cytochrome c oxidase subunit II
VKIPSSIWTLLVGILLTLVSLWYGQNHNLLPTAASKEAFLVDGLFNTMMVVSTGIFILVEGILIYAAIKYRRRAGDDSDGQPVHGNVPLEILWTAIPAIIVLGISVYSFDVYNEMGGFDPHGGHGAPMAPEAMKMQHGHGSAIAATLSDASNANQEKSDAAMQDPATAAVRNADQIPQKKDAPGMGVKAPTLGASADRAGKEPDLVINVTGLQYAFIFTYPESGVSSGELHVPAGKEVKLNMSANDVIHAFWVPEFRLKQDIIPGRQTEVRFTPQTIGEYVVVCAELCGPYHGAMRAPVVVQSQQDYDSWIQEQLVASRETMNQAVAMNPDVSADNFLAHYTHSMGIQPEVLHQVHH